MKNLLIKNKPILLAAVLYAIDTLITMAVYSTDNYEFANTATNISGIVGVLAAILLGIGMVKLILDIALIKGGLTRDLKLTMAFFILTIVSVPGIFFGAPLIPLILALVFLFRAWRSPMNSPPKQLTTGNRVFIGIGMFLSTGIIGLALSGLFYLMTWSRACELSSSKCI